MEGAAMPSAAARPATQPEPRIHVLVCEDEALTASWLATELEARGYGISGVAENGAQALLLARMFQPDVILMDIRMPQVDGIEATRQIRSEPWGKAMVIVALTGWGQESNRRQTREVGMDLHLVKPINLEGIAAVLAHT